MQFRHESKHVISYSDMLALRARLAAVMSRDSHASGGKYHIRSLYFDDISDSALRAKLDGVNRRVKYRLRCYNGDLSCIMLERKTKINGLCQKERQRITPEEAKALLRRDGIAASDGAPELLRELCLAMQTSGLRPKALVDYTREPFVWAPGNTRVTLDYDIRTGLTSTDFMNTGCVTVPVRDAPIILEVKWDGFLPSLIRDIVRLEEGHACTFSKYAACRVYG